MCLQLNVLLMWGLGGLQVYGICSYRLVHSEVVEVRSNYNLFSFHNILGFCYKRSRQLFYYEGTLSYIILKILERVNSYFSEFLWITASKNTPIRQKHVQSRQQKRRYHCFRNEIRVSLYLAWKIFLKLASFRNLQVFILIAVKESVTGAAFSKACHCKWQWES